MTIPFKHDFRLSVPPSDGSVSVSVPSPAATEPELSVIDCIVTRVKPGVSVTSFNVTLGGQTVTPKSPYPIDEARPDGAVNVKFSSQVILTRSNQNQQVRCVVTWTGQGKHEVTGNAIVKVRCEHEYIFMHKHH